MLISYILQECSCISVAAANLKGGEVIEFPSNVCAITLDVLLCVYIYIHGNNMFQALGTHNILEAISVLANITILADRRKKKKINL